MNVPPLAALLADQCERWGRGERVLVEAYLRQYPALRADTESVLDLIYNEVYLREQRGEVPTRDEYQRCFPDLTEAIGTQFDVHQTIQAAAVAETELPVIPGFELLAEIGRGGMGRVFRARGEKGGYVVAVKVLHAEHLRRRGVRKRFKAEAQAAAMLDHPHIVRVLAVGECDAGPFFVMELIEGRSLEAIIRSGIPEPIRAAGWIIDVADAIHYAHSRGIIHRDLKPANIMIDGAGRPRVMDFGMAKVLRGAVVAGIASPQEGSSTQEGSILGTPAYMPPEQAGESDIKPGPYSDVYSLGAVLYALLTGRPPFDGGDFLDTVLQVRSPQPPPPLRSLRPDVPDILEQICHKCLNKRPADRYASAAAVAAALRRFLDPSRAVPTVPFALCSLTTGEVIPLTKDVTIIGRSPECDVVVAHPNVSRRHCRIIRTAAEVIVEDLGSMQGTSVNGARVTRAPLRDGDRLEMAQEVFTLRLRQSG